MSLSLSHWYTGSAVVLDCIDSRSLHPYLLYLVVIFITIAKVKFKLKPDVNTLAICLINQSEDIGGKQLIVFGFRGAELAPFMHVALSTYVSDRTPRL